MQSDPVGFWLGRVALGSRKTYDVGLKGFLRWLGQREGKVLSASDLLARQMETQDQYAVLDLLQKYVSEMPLALNSKISIYTAVRSFFMHNRCALPSDLGFKVRGSKAPLPAKLSVEHVRRMVQAANLRDRSIVLVKWMGLQDTDRLVWIGRNLAQEIVTQMKEGVHPVRLEIPQGRKNNDRGYYTFIGKDAIDALKEYFEKERGWPKPKEPVWLERYGKPLSEAAFNYLWLNLLRRVGLIEKREGQAGTRYGFYAHGTRHQAKSLLHVQAKAEGFDMDCCEFWLGHVVDPLGYDKFHLDKEYVRKQYVIAEKYLNIVSRPAVSEEQRHQEQETVLKMRKELDEVKQLLSQLVPAKAAP